MIPGVRDTELPYINRGLACKTVAHEHQDLKGNTPVHRQPVQFRTDKILYMPELRNPTNQSSSSIQNRLQLINMRQRYTSVNCTTTDKRMHEGPGSFRGQRAAYRTNLPQMVKTRATYTAHMPGKGQFLVQDHPRSRTVVENRTPGKGCSKMERSILDNCTRSPTQMNCVFPWFNLRRFEDNQAPITSETRSIFSTREVASEATL